MQLLHTLGRVLLSALFVGAGVMHFARTGFFLWITPPWVPFPKLAVWLSGVVEIAVGLALWYPPLAPAAAWCIVALLVAFVPVHVHMLRDAQRFAAIPKVLLWTRLALQALLVAWAWSYTRA